MPDPTHTHTHDSTHIPAPAARPLGELHCGGSQIIALHGHAFQLALWIARHQPRINTAAAEAGQLTLHWKGLRTLSITGEIRTRL